MLKNQGFNFFVGVPCSILKGFLASLGQEVTYVPATREDEAIGIAVGAYLGGLRPVVFMQNAGLGLSINAISSLVLLYNIPLLMLVTWRGYSNNDAPEHNFMGSHTTSLLEAMEIPTFILEKENTGPTIQRAWESAQTTKGPAAILIREGVL